MTFNIRRAIWAATLFSTLVTTLVTTRAEAQAPDASRKYAVLSLMGDSLTIVSQQIATGSRLNKNIQQQLPVSDEAFDVPALRASAAVLQRRGVKGEVALMTSSTPTLYADMEALLKVSPLALPADLREALKESKATHLIVLSKLRADTDVRFLNQSGGTGTLEGLGFYYDSETRVVKNDTGETFTGYVAAYVYLNVTLVDLSTMQALQSEVVRTTETVLADTPNTSSNPWNALSAAQKVGLLRKMIETELGRVLPKLIR